MEQYEEKNACVQSRIVDKVLPLELNTELSLPDYRSEISRLLWVRPTFLPPTRFIAGGNADFSGRVRYDALYAGPDGKLYSADAEDSYSFSLPLDAANGAEISAAIFPDVVVGRVAAARKLAVRCRAHAHVQAYAEESLGIALAPELEARACRLGEMAESGRFIATMGESVELSDDFSHERADQTRIISARGEVFLPEVTALPGQIHCRGEVIVTLLCCTEAEEEQGVPYTVVRRLPLEADLALEGVTGEHKARASASVGEVRAAVEDGRISLGVRVELCAEAQCAEPLYYVKDMYVPGMRAECHLAEKRLWLPALCCNKNYSISGNMTPSDIGMPAEAEILDAAAEAEVREREATERGTALSGEMHCHILYRCGSEYGVSDACVPFRVVMSEGSVADPCVRASVPVCSARMEKERVRVDAELLLSVRGACEERILPLMHVELRPMEDTVHADIELYYPAAGETLWDVGKRYAMPPEEIARANGIGAGDPGAPNSLDGVHYLMMPPSHMLPEA